VREKGRNAGTVEDSTSEKRKETPPPQYVENEILFDLVVAYEGRTVEPGDWMERASCL
jgi:hypothetical protein